MSDNTLANILVLLTTFLVNVIIILVFLTGMHWLGQIGILFVIDMFIWDIARKLEIIQ